MFYNDNKFILIVELPAVGPILRSKTKQDRLASVEEDSDFETPRIDLKPVSGTKRGRASTSADHESDKEQKKKNQRKKSPAVTTNKNTLLAERKAKDKADKTALKHAEMKSAEKAAKEAAIKEGKKTKIVAKGAVKPSPKVASVIKRPIGRPRLPPETESANEDHSDSSVVDAKWRRSDDPIVVTADSKVFFETLIESVKSHLSEKVDVVNKRVDDLMNQQNSKVLSRGKEEIESAGECKGTNVSLVAMRRQDHQDRRRPKEVFKQFS